jgi:hypothetical protein
MSHLADSRAILYVDGPKMQEAYYSVPNKGIVLLVVSCDHARIASVQNGG